MCVVLQGHMTVVPDEDEMMFGPMNVGVIAPGIGREVIHRSSHICKMRVIRRAPA